MPKRAKKTQNREAKNRPVLRLYEFIGEFIFESTVSLGIQQVYSIFEEARERLCDPRCRNNENREAYRSGYKKTT